MKREYGLYVKDILLNKRVFHSPPHMGGQELEFVRQAFKSNYIAPLGSHVNAFEKEFSEIVGIPHAAAVSSGTAAMHLSLRLLGGRPRRRGCRSFFHLYRRSEPGCFSGRKIGLSWATT